MSTAIWFIPFLVHHLGPSAYGLIPLAVTVTSYMTIMTQSVRSAVSRDLLYALVGDGDDSPGAVFNTAFFALLGITIPLALVSLLLVGNLESILSIPEGFELSARHLFAMTCVAFLVSTIASPFGASATAKHRLDLCNWISITAALARIVTVTIAFTILSPSLLIVGVGALIAAAIESIGTIFTWKRLTPFLCVRASEFKPSILRRLLGTGAWTIIGQIGTLLLMSIDLLLVNRIFGPEDGGLFALALQWALLLRLIANVMAGTFTPTITHAYATRASNLVKNTTVQSIKFVGLAIAFPIGMICGFSDSLLSIWLGIDFSELSGLLILLTAPLIVQLPLTPIFALALAADRLRAICFSTLILGIINPFIAWFLAVPLGWGMIGIGASSGALYALRSFLIDLPLAEKIEKGTGKESTKALFLATFVCAIIAIISWIINKALSPDCWPEILFCISAILAIACPSVYFAATNPEERLAVKKLIRLPIASDN